MKKKPVKQGAITEDCHVTECGVDSQITSYTYTSQEQVVIARHRGCLYRLGSLLLFLSSHE